MRYVIKLFGRFPLLSLDREEDPELMDLISNLGGQFDLAGLVEEDDSEYEEEDRGFGFVVPR